MIPRARALCILSVMVLLSVCGNSAPGEVSQECGEKMSTIVDDHKPGTKYVAFQADTEAAFTPRDFPDFQGVFTPDIIKVCEKYDVPYTWLIIVDEDHTEVKYIADEVYPARKDIDEFSLHVHFKWFIMKRKYEHKTFKIPAERIAWLTEAKEHIDKPGLPRPRTFRYGGGDSQAKYYHIQDLIFLVDELGVRNFMFGADRLPGVVDIKEHKHKGNNVWTIDGDREITLLSTTVYLDRDTDKVIEAIDKRLENADYSIIGCHDYRKIVPGNMEAAIKHIRKNFPTVKFVTSDEIGELVRAGKIRN